MQVSTSHELSLLPPTHSFFTTPPPIALWRIPALNGHASRSRAAHFMTTAYPPLFPDCATVTEKRTWTRRWTWERDRRPNGRLEEHEKGARLRGVPHLHGDDSHICQLCAAMSSDESANTQKCVVLRSTPPNLLTRPIALPTPDDALRQRVDCSL
ncbi:hypothetical protein C8F01DRAFT_1145882 [Mycena amicta]|nr:hypothetical protein C8F01DRAFT_1145882 [Mycena amicta]